MSHASWGARLGQVVVATALAIGWGSAAWAKHGDPAIIRDLRNKRDALVGQRPAARERVQAGVQGARQGRHHFKTDVAPGMRASGASKADIRAARRATMSPLRAERRDAKHDMKKLNNQIGGYNRAIKALTTHKHDDDDGGGIPHPPNPFGFLSRSGARTNYRK